MAWCNFHVLLLAGWHFVALYSVSLDDVPNVLAGCKSGNFAAKGKNECAGIQRLQCEMNGKCSGTLQGKPYQINCNQKQECVTHKWGGALVRKFFSSVKQDGSMTWSNGCSWICQDTPSDLVRHEGHTHLEEPADALEQTLIKKIGEGFGTSKEKPLKLACVCSGNTCRSPICFHYLHKMLNEAKSSSTQKAVNLPYVNIYSSGTCTGLPGRDAGKVTRESAFILKENDMDSNVASNDGVYVKIQDEVQNSVNKFNQETEGKPAGTGIFFHQSQATDEKWLKQITDEPNTGIIIAMDQQTVERLGGRKACGKKDVEGVEKPSCQTQWQKCIACTEIQDTNIDCAAEALPLTERPVVHLLNNGKDVTDPYEPVTDPHAPGDYNGNPIEANPAQGLDCGKAKNSEGNCIWDWGAYTYGLYDRAVRTKALSTEGCTVKLGNTNEALYTALTSKLGADTNKTFVVGFTATTKYAKGTGECAGKLTTATKIVIPIAKANSITYTYDKATFKLNIKVEGEAKGGLFKYLESYVEGPDYYCGATNTDEELVFHHSIIKWAKYSAMADVVKAGVDKIATLIISEIDKQKNNKQPNVVS